MAMGLFSVSQRPTGVRVQLGVEMWEDIELFGDA